MAKKRNIEIKCSHCEKKFNDYDSQFRPFCSERCKAIDLGHWLSESYVAPAQTPLSDEDIEKVERSLQEKYREGGDGE